MRSLETSQIAKLRNESIIQKLKELTKILFIQPDSGSQIHIPAEYLKENQENKEDIFFVLKFLSLILRCFHRTIVDDNLIEPIEKENMKIGESYKKVEEKSQSSQNQKIKNDFKYQDMTESSQIINFLSEGKLEELKKRYFSGLQHEKNCIYLFFGLFFKFLSQECIDCNNSKNKNEMLEMRNTINQDFFAEVDKRKKRHLKAGISLRKFDPKNRELLLNITKRDNKLKTKILDFIKDYNTEMTGKARKVVRTEINNNNERKINEFFKFFKNLTTVPTNDSAKIFRIVEMFLLNNDLLRPLFHLEAEESIEMVSKILFQTQ